MKKCLIVVDYQYDFVADDGLLTAGKPAQFIEPFISRRVYDYLNNSQNVFFTLDTHTQKNWNSHPESRQFNMHCERGTKGWELFGTLNRFMADNNEYVELVEKKGYSPDNEFLTRLSCEFDEIEIMGVVTDICVFQTAVGIYNTVVNQGQLVKLSVSENGCASFNAEGHRYALDYMRNTLGFEII